MKLALLAGTHSGCGKTTLTLALLQYLKNRALPVRAFKVGPDFLDPLWHFAVTGQPSYNLDTQMIGLDLSQHLLSRWAGEDSYGVIEGVMGMFDGRTGVGQAGSSVDLARQLQLPVILVVDAQGISGSIAPLVSGYCQFAQQLGVTVSGVIANRLGGDFHANLLREALAAYQLPPLLAWMSKGAPMLEERHLGLKTPLSGAVPDLQACLRVDEAKLMSAFLRYAAPVLSDVPRLDGLQGKTVAIARDEACCFIYPANVDWLLAQGARLQWFSPLAGEAAPAADAMWLPGGYPELYASRLAASKSLPSIKAFVEAGRPVLAECGGAMLLGADLVDLAGAIWPMARVLPFRSRMQNTLAALGYRQDVSGMRGHEFHYSLRECEGAMAPGFDCTDGDKGVRYNNLRASYVHWYFASAPSAAIKWFT